MRSAVSFAQIAVAPRACAVRRNFKTLKHGDISYK
jgi:hypothetical protein